MKKLSRLKFLLSLVASLTSLGLGAASPQAPKLLVGIMVEGLDGDCLDLLRVGLDPLVGHEDAQ